MAEYQTYRAATAGVRTAEIDAGLRAHMNKVYGTMSGGLLITALAAWAIAGLAVTSDINSAAVNSEGFALMLREGQFLTGLGETLYATPLRWVIMFAPLAFIFFGWGALMRRGSAATVQLGFLIFSAVMGLSLSSIFLVFTGASIAQTFLVTAIAFASLSLYGYTTKRDLSGMGTFLIMGVVGLILAMIVNMFLGSAPLMFAISVLGVLIFAGLTAFYTQDIKTTYVSMAHHGDQEWLDKAAYDGALSLYISFLNMFQFLLMFMGQQE
ncbi:membrane protein [Candidatus Rhodobacter oscarellae]|uniref:Membrane protein n=1 Tax=Candidatus Rhodobacter oscarellae TaxID=1675527 RepID=A0A0J9E0Y0_9RHOB|nr:Bax inhibitor-1/YccA family protein [Candidatus Rhodobacter lobularis]KMW56332.1 membrane protein [Candidatus Rhodobacter lobularis]